MTWTGRTNAGAVVADGLVPADARRARRRRQPRVAVVDGPRRSARRPRSTARRAPPTFSPNGDGAADTTRLGVDAPPSASPAPPGSSTARPSIRSWAIIAARRRRDRLERPRRAAGAAVPDGTYTLRVDRPRRRRQPRASGRSRSSSTGRSRRVALEPRRLRSAGRRRHRCRPPRLLVQPHADRPRSASRSTRGATPGPDRLDEPHARRRRRTAGRGTAGTRRRARRARGRTRSGSAPGAGSGRRSLSRSILVDAFRVDPSATVAPGRPDPDPHVHDDRAAARPPRPSRSPSRAGPAVTRTATRSAPGATGSRFTVATGVAGIGARSGSPVATPPAASTRSTRTVTIR